VRRMILDTEMVHHACGMEEPLSREVYLADWALHVDMLLHGRARELALEEAIVPEWIVFSA
jgi:hypothetical protein